MKEISIDLASIVCDCFPVQGGEVNLVGRETGKAVRESLSRIFQEEDGPALFHLDFDSLHVVDYSCADELFGKLLPRVLADEFGGSCVCLVNISPAQAENITAALERRGLAVAARRRRGGWTFLGKLNPYLQETFRMVYNYRRISARELSQELQLALNTGSTRLINLHKQRLVGRRQDRNTQGFREFIYESFSGGFGLA